MTCPECDSPTPVGVEDPDIYDGILWWMCLGCGHAWVRDTEVDYRRKWAEKFVQVHNHARAYADVDLLDQLDDPHDHCGQECCG